MGGNHLNCLWPILKIVQLMGGFPLKKSKESPCGFKQLSTGVYLAIVLSAFFIANASHFLSWFYLICIFELTLDDLREKVFGDSGSKLDNWIWI